MISKQIEISPIHFEFRLSHVYKEDPEKAYSIYFEAVSKYGVKPTTEMSKYIILSLLFANKLERALQLFEWMKSESLDTSGLYSCFSIYCIKEEEKGDTTHIDQTKILITTCLKRQ